MIDHFTREQFEAALPLHHETQAPLWKSTGIVKGEYTYVVPVPNKYFQGSGVLAVTIRSSVKPDGESASVGEDSIRCWLIDQQTGAPFGSKLQKYVTRVPGWQVRMTDLIRTLYRVGMKLKPCPKCQKMMKAFKVQKGDNKGRLFQSCPKPTGKNRGKGREGCGSGFEWIELPDEEKKPKTKPTPPPSPTPVKAGELPPDYGVGRTGKREAWRDEGKD